jgi:hypothetical protein
MKRACFISLFLCLTTSLLSQSNPVSRINQTAGVVSPITASPAAPQAQARILDGYGKLPLSFEANHGQTDSRVKFLSRTSGYSLFLTGDEVVLALSGKKANTKAKIVDTAHTLPENSTVASQNKPRCFAAYPSSPVDRAESIEKAIEEIRVGGVVDIAGWKSLAISGRVVISAICDQIKTSEIFIADVTGLNPNVLFELGYAIAHKKRVWLLLNQHIERAQVFFNRFQLLTTVGYAPYSNSREIVEQFYRDGPYNNVDQNLYEELLIAAGPPSKKDALLYLRCDVDTEASLRVARRISTGPIRSVIDDPQEVRRQPFSWYVQQVTSAFGVVCHFLSTEYRDWELHNAKHACRGSSAVDVGGSLAGYGLHTNARRQFGIESQMLERWRAAVGSFARTPGS